MKSMVAYMGVAVLVGTAAIAAGCKVTVVDGAGGTGTTSSSTKATTSSTKASTGSGVTSGTTTGGNTTTTGGGTCDTGVASDANCKACQDCATADACSAQLDACQGDADCVAFAMCVDPCTDQACFDQCVADHQTGSNLYNELALCVICDTCPGDCDGPGAGCP
ncbi:MAG: hypothetical protein U0414_02375 [Polyangiaceae bacterium]